MGGGARGMDEAGACELLLVRHGQTEWNVARKWQGQQNSPLTAAGLRGATLLGRRIATDPSLSGITAVYTSDLGRTVQTTEAILAGAGGRLAEKVYVTDTRLRECSFGRLEGTSRSGDTRAVPKRRPVSAAITSRGTSPSQSSTKFLRRCSFPAVDTSWSRSAPHACLMWCATSSTTYLVILLMCIFRRS